MAYLDTRPQNNRPVIIGLVAVIHDDDLPLGSRIVEPPISQPTPSFVPRSARPSNDRAGWATTSDYPSRDLREGNQGITGFKLIVGESGRVENCIVTKSSGFVGLDEATCKHVPRRAKFKPATDGSGQPTTGEYTGQIRWVIPE